MKNTLLLMVILSLTIFSCKTKKAVTKDSSTTTPVEQISTKIDDKSNVEPGNSDDMPILIKTEEVSIADNEDQSKGGYAFYVIIGSFSKPENAVKFKKELSDKGFTPVLLNGESGFVRVAVDQSNSEKDARALVLKIRKEYPEHTDVWLLKKK